MTKALLIGAILVSFIGLGSMVYSHGMDRYGLAGNRWSGCGRYGAQTLGSVQVSSLCRATQMRGTYGSQELIRDDAEHIVEDYLAEVGNPNLKMGRITETEQEFQIEIVTQDNSLVERLIIDRETGRLNITY